MTYMPSIENAEYYVRWVRKGVLDQYGLPKVCEVPCKSYADAMVKCMSLSINPGIRGEEFTAYEALPYQNPIALMSVR